MDRRRSLPMALGCAACLAMAGCTAPLRAEEPGGAGGRAAPMVAVVLVLHSCEIPDGRARAAEGCAAVGAALRPQDELGVLFYHWQEGERWHVPLQPIGDSTALARACGDMDIGDMPSFDAPLDRALLALRGSSANVKQVMVVSDGDPQPPATSLLEGYAKLGIAVTTIAVGPHAGPEGPEVALMQRLASTTGGRFRLVEDPSSLPAVLAEETARLVPRLH